MEEQPAEFVGRCLQILLTLMEPPGRNCGFLKVIVRLAFQAAQAEADAPQEGMRRIGETGVPVGKPVMPSEKGTGEAAYAPLGSPPGKTAHRADPDVDGTIDAW